jgi:DNA/RNA-binding protein KIN17
VRVFAESPEAFVEFYSKEFLDAFMEELRRKTENVRSKATSIWKSVIAERHHIHLNATKWLTLTEFVKYIGKEGLADVDVDEEGKWHVRYINRDPAAEERKKALERKEKMDQDDSERAARMVEKQIKEAQKALKERGLAPNADSVAAASQELRRENGEKISLGSISAPAAGKSAAVTRPAAAFGASDDSGDEATETVGGRAGGGAGARGTSGGTLGSGDVVGQKRKLTAVEEIMLKEKRQKEEASAQASRKRQEEEEADLDVGDGSAPWLLKGIVVKVMHKKLADGKFYKKKGVVQQVRDSFVGEVKMLESGHVLKLDQEHLETVIPAAGGEILVVGGKHKGKVGVLQALLEEKFAARSPPPLPPPPLLSMLRTCARKALRG